MNRKKHLMKVVQVANYFGYLNPPKRDRRYWIHPFNTTREETRRFLNFYEKIRLNSDKFFTYYRMSIASFDELMMKIRPYITKQETKFRSPICAEERLTLTIR
ncbi:uncharacterized protein LOC111026950 [Myzus persicae]|uniref:uncharacterized protein LOC111026950 n=1 Tax=Myzus persicae TaxID=13164 RepID=UPI000B9366F9|nr:uncharacterized protein LOC111026950 [Myzus persicae]